MALYRLKESYPVSQERARTLFWDDHATLLLDVLHILTPVNASILCDLVLASSSLQTLRDC